MHLSYTLGSNNSHSFYENLTRNKNSLANQTRHLQACRNSAPVADRPRSSAQNLLDALDFSGALILLCKKGKIIGSKNF